MSATLIDQYRQLHEQRPDYGSGRDDAHIAAVIQGEMGERLKDVRSALDYGCGKSRLLEKLFPPHETAWGPAERQPPVVMQRYDPAIPELSMKHDWAGRCTFDLIVCNDVLEHIPEDELPTVLSEIQDATGGKVFFTIHCGPASNRLPNGENCHCTVHTALWWLNLLGGYWTTQKLLWASWPRFIVMVEKPVPAETEKRKRSCFMCDGKGEVQRQPADWVPCPRCHGNGQDW